MKQILKKYFKTEYVSIAGFSLFTIMLFSPFVMYVTNADELWFGMSYFLPMLVLWTVLAVLVCGVLLSVIPKKISDAVAVVIFALGIGTYIQGQILKNDYGTLDGTEVDWSLYKSTAVTNTIIWLVILLVFITLFTIFGQKLIGVLKSAALILIAYEVLMSAILLVTNAQSDSKNADGAEGEQSYAVATADMHLTTDGIYEVSSRTNVIALVLDEYDSATFLEMLDKYPDAAGIFDGFRYYPDTVAATGRTRYSIPYIFSGQLHTDAVSYEQYRDLSFRDSKLVERIIADKVNSGIYCDEAYVGRSVPEAIGNMRTAKASSGSVLFLTKDMLKLSCFRSFPHILKKYMWLYTGDFDKYKSSDIYNPSDDPTFFAGLLEHKLTAVTQNPVFRYIHLKGDHAPYNIMPDGSVGESDRVGQARGCLEFVRVYLEDLKELGVYDDSYIIVMSDHGRGADMEDTSGNPIFLVKPMQAKGLMQKSDSPMHLSCLQQMFSDAFDGCVEYPDDYIEMPKNRYYYHWLNNTPGIAEYEYFGKAYAPDKVVATGKKYTGDLATGTGDYVPYEYGMLLSFGGDVNGFAYVTEGIDFPKDNFAWLNGDRTVFRFKVPTGYDTIRLYMFAYAGGGQQNLKFYANGEEVSSVLFTGGELTVDIPSTALDDGKLELTMEHTDTSSMSVGLINMYINPVL